MARIFLKRTLTGFVPVDQDGAEDVRKFKVGEIYRADVVKPRSYQHHKLIMALLTLTYRNLPEKVQFSNGAWVETKTLWPTFDKFRRSVALYVGHVEQFIDMNGEIHSAPGSLSYDALDEVEFTRVSTAMMTWCATILDMSEPELAGEVSRYADQNYGAAA